MTAGKFFNKRDISSLTVCESENGPKAKCLDILCKNCGVQRITRYYSDIKDFCEQERKEVKWHKWEYITINRDDKEKRIISCVQKTSSIIEFLNDYENDMQSYTSHIIHANWQHEKMSACISKLKPNQVIMVMDFAKNYKCGFQNEVQSA